MTKDKDRTGPYHYLFKKVKANHYPFKKAKAKSKVKTYHYER